MPKVTWRKRNLAFIAGLSLVVLGVAACEVMESEPEVWGAQVGCSGQLGSYQLATSKLRIDFAATLGANGTTSVELTGPFAEARPDPHHIYCLDHLLSPTSNDVIAVRRSVPKDATTPNKDLERQSGKTLLRTLQDTSGAFDSRKDTQLLRAIASSSTDLSGVILQRISKLVSKIPTLKLDTSLKVFSTGRAEQTVNKSISFDPFDAAHTQMANLALREFGLCVVFDKYTIRDPLSGDLPRVTTKAMSDYCNGTPSSAPIPVGLSYSQRASRSQTIVETKGVYYRLKLPYNVYVLSKSDPGGSGPWEPFHAVTVEMENLSPIVSIGVDRALFSQRNTVLVFDDGALSEVCFAKGSELAGAAEIPLALVTDLIQAPWDALTAQAQRERQRAELAKIETKLINTQIAHINYLELDAEAKIAANLDQTVNSGDITQAELQSLENGSSPTLDLSDAVTIPDGFLDPERTSSRFQALCPQLFEG